MLKNEYGLRNITYAGRLFMYTENALFFPKQVIPTLRGLRGAEWSALIDRVANLPETHEDVLAFMLMMVRLDGCMCCETDSYRAMRGCMGCAHQTLRRYKGTDAELLALFEVALHDVRQFVQNHPAVG